MILLLSLVAVLIINILLFLEAYIRQSDKLTDFSYALSFVGVIVATLALSDQYSSILLLLSGMVVIWAIRLGGFLAIRIHAIGKDARFDDIRGNFFKFLSFWLSQAIVAWILLLPVLLAAGQTAIWGLSTSIGVIVWIVALSIETIADIQKFRFTQNSVNKGKWIDKGLWRSSRHPNYFGEIFVWVGVYLVAFGSLDTTGRVVGLVSPFVIFITLRFVSGVPLLEKSADARWGKDPKYQAYKKRTKLLVPFWTRTNRR